MDYILPADVVAERNFLGCVMTIGEYSKVAGVVYPIPDAWFSNNDYKAVFKIIKRLVIDAIGPEFSIVRTEDKNLATVVDEIEMSDTPLTYQLNALANRLREVFIRRQAVIESERLINMCVSNSESSASIIDNFQATTVKLAKGGVGLVERKTKDKLFTATQEIYDASKGISNKHIQYYIPFVDEAVSHYRKQIHAIGGYSGGGKTTFALQCFTEQAMKGRKVVYFITESEPEELLKRAIGYLGKVSIVSLLRGISGNEAPRFEDAVGKLQKCRNNMFIIGSDQWDMSIEGVESWMRQLKQDNGELDCVYLDYLQDLMAPKSEICRTNEEVVGYNAKRFKKLCGELDCAGVLLSQLNRDSESSNKPPGKKAFRGSGQIEHVCHLMSVVYTPGSEEENSRKTDVEALWYSVKTRLVPPWNKKLDFRRDVGRFEDSDFGKDGHRYKDQYRNPVGKE